VFAVFLQERLAAAGGRVFFNSGLRVMGILATTRAIGDHDLRPYGVVPTPDVVVLPRAVDHEFLVLGSDGLWDVFNNQVGSPKMQCNADG
jgi:protein phosphatase 2C